MDASSVFTHFARIAHGIGASVLYAVVFYVAGFVLLLGSRDRRVSGVAPAFLGAALYVVLCGVGVEKGIPVSRLALVFAAAAMLAGVAAHRAIRILISNPSWRRTAAESFLGFAGLYVVAYLFTMPPAAPNQLPVAWSGDADLMTYVRYTRYFLHLGPSNLAEFSYFNDVYRQVPGVFHLLGAFSLFFNQDPLSAAMPAQFALTAFTGAIAAAISRSSFGLSFRASVAIGCIFIIGPFFRYVAAGYSLSTLMTMPVLLWLLWITVEERSGRTVDAALARQFGAAYVLLLLINPFVFVAGFCLQMAAIVLRLLADLQAREIAPLPRSAFARAARTFTTGAILFAVLTAGFWSRMQPPFESIVPAAEQGAADRELRMISPQAILALPGAGSRAIQVSPESPKLALAAFGGITASLLIIYFWWFRLRTTPAQAAFAGVLASAIVVYCGYFSTVGPSYQQWKFASYLLLPLSFVPLAVVAQALSSVMVRERFALSSNDRRLAAAFPVILAIAMIAGNVAAHAAFDPSLRRLPIALRAIREIDELRTFREITVRMSDVPDSLPTSLALYYLPQKKVHVVSTKFDPSVPLSLETVSRQRPLLMQNFGCSGVGHDATQSIQGVGCLLFAPPSMQFGTTYPFNRTFLFLTYEGMTARGADGRWNSRQTVPLRVSIDPERTRVDGPAYLNLLVKPKEGSTPQRLTFRWGSDQRGEASIASEEWISLTVRSADWTGNRLWRLTALIDIPPGASLLFSELSLTETPRGQLIK